MGPISSVDTAIGNSVRAGIETSFAPRITLCGWSPLLPWRATLFVQVYRRAIDDQYQYWSWV